MTAEEKRVDELTPDQHDASPEEAEQLHEAEESEVNPWQDKAMRAMADLENTRRRSAKEVADARQFAVTGFAREMLSVADNMERALATETDDVEKLKEGVTMVAEQLKSTFAKFNISRIESMGQKLNPDLHQVMVEVESEELAGTVVQEMQPGYTIGERLLRPALVGVSKG